MSATTTKIVAKDKDVKDKEKKKKKTSNRVFFWAAECKYVVIIDRVNELGWKTTDDEKLMGKTNVWWIDVATIQERMRQVQPWQIINHFPGMPNIARKNRMGQNLNKMLKLFPKEYSFYPRTWILPGEMADFRNQFDNSGNSLGNKIFIIKPDAGCQGRGIYLTKTWEKVPLNENVVAQMYIKKPLLIDNFKFDLRLYCLVSCVKPLRAYLFHDGLVRMCTEEYVKPNKQNLDQSCMHLTNYAVNKANDNFIQPGSEDGDSGSKRSLQWFMDWIREEHGDAKADWLWKRMGVLCMRTILSILPTLSKEYDQHFKSFNNIPVDIRKIPSASTGYAVNSGGATGTGAGTSAGAAASAPSAPSSGSGAGAADGSRGGRLHSRSGSARGDQQSHSGHTSDEDNGNSAYSGSGGEGAGAGANRTGSAATNHRKTGDTNDGSGTSGPKSPRTSRTTEDNGGADHQESDGEGGKEDDGEPKIRGSRFVAFNSCCYTI
jgi:tubulin polyglutamylase TTLL6/13